MWISKKKLNQMIEESAAKECEREMMYHFMDEMHIITSKMKDIILQLNDEIADLHHIIHSGSGATKKKLNG